MELEFLIVGIAKKSREDLRALYEETASEVFGLALSIVKDTALAADILAETYRRIVTLAYLFNTDLSAEYWLLDMTKNLAYNTMHDQELSKRCLSPKQDNLSKVLMELINNSKEDRASIIAARCLSELNKRDIAKLLWYKTGACNKEYKRGINRLAEKVPNIEKNRLAEHIVKDIKAIVPDVWDVIISKEDTPLSHISHEELNLNASELIYSDDDKEKALQLKHTAQKRRKRSIIAAAVIAAVIIVANLTVVLVTNILKNDESTDEISLQFGNRIAIARIGQKTFYQNTQKNNELWIYDEADGKSRALLSDPIKELISDGSRLYYRNLADGYIYTVNLDGSGKNKLTETPGTCLTLYNGRIYFSTASGISSINTDGSDEQIYIAIDMQSDDMSYFSGMGLELYRYMIKFSPEGILHFSAGAGKGIYYIENFGGQTGLELVYSDEAYTFEITENSIYFDLKTYDEKKNALIKLYELDRESRLFTPLDGFLLGTGAFCIEDGLVYFDGSVNDEYGIYVYSLTEKTAPVKLSSLRASDLFMTENKLYVYYPGSNQTPGAYLNILELSESGTSVNNEMTIFDS